MPFSPFGYDGDSKIQDLVTRYCEAKLREQLDGLEQEAEALLRMGYAISDLTIVAYPDGSKQIHPIDEEDTNAIQ